MRNSKREMLDLAHRELFLGVKLSKQSSYARRAPDPESLVHFDEAQRLLTCVLEQEPNNREALLMMSQICESVLHFPAAIEYLDRAFKAGEPRIKKTLKRLALLKENANEWDRLKLTPEMLRRLGDYLQAKGVGPNHRSLDLTREWIAANVDSNPDKVIAALEERGAFTDFQVLANIVYG